MGQKHDCKLMLPLSTGCNTTLPVTHEKSMQNFNAIQSIVVEMFQKEPIWFEGPENNPQPLNEN